MKISLTSPQLNRFIKWKEIKTVRKALQKSPLTIKQRKVKQFLKKITQFNHPNKEKYLFLIIKWLDKLLLAPIFLYYMSVVLLGLQQTRFPLRQLFIENLNWFLSFKNYFKLLIYRYIIKINSKIQKVRKLRILEKKINYFQDSTNNFSLKDLFLQDFLVIENSYLILLKNKWLLKKKINDYLFFKYCYLLKIKLFYSIIKGKNLLKDTFLKLKSLFKFKPFFFKDNKSFTKTVKKEFKFKKRIFKYRYNFSLSRVCNQLRYIYFKNRWEEKTKNDKNTKDSFFFKNYALYTGLVALPQPISYEKKKCQVNF